MCKRKKNQLTEQEKINIEKVKEQLIEDIKTYNRRELKRARLELLQAKQLLIDNLNEEQRALFYSYERKAYAYSSISRRKYL